MRYGEASDNCPRYKGPRIGKGEAAAEYLLAEENRTPETSDLCKAGQARLHLVTGGIACGHGGEFQIVAARTDSVRAWPDKRHIANQYIEKLWQFIQGTAA